MSEEWALTNLLSGLATLMTLYLIPVMAYSILLAQSVIRKEKRFPATTVALKVVNGPSLD